MTAGREREANREFKVNQEYKSKEADREDLECLKLCDSEYRFMTIVWEVAPVKSGQLVSLCNERLGWKKSTTYTVIKKLSERGFLQNDNATVHALVKQEDCQAVESDYFVNRTFGGSLPMFIAAFLGNKQLSEEEAEQIKQMIDTHRQ